jgi:hypothetical protein
VDEHRYEATASDVVGTATGEAWGNAFRWEYTLALEPGNPLKNVHMKQWMYGQGDGGPMMKPRHRDEAGHHRRRGDRVLPARAAGAVIGRLHLP